MNPALQWVLAQVNEWLKFGEAKNGVLLVANVALLVGLWQSASLPAIFGVYSELYFAVLQCLLAIGAVAAAFSFVPATEIPRLKPRGRPESTDSLVFFGHLAKYTGQHLLTAYERKGLLQSPRQPLDDQLADQIVLNSRIAGWKFLCFKWAFWLTLAGIITPVAAVPLFAIFHWARNHGNR